MSLPIAQPLCGRLARALLWFLAVELAVMLLVGWSLHRAGWACGSISAMLCAWFFGLRIALVSWNFIQAERARSPRPPQHQLSIWGAIRLWWGEYWVTQITYSFLFPFEDRLVPLAPVAAARGDGTPIVLVPGFACNRGYWWFMVRALEKAGMGPVFAVTLEPVLGGIDDNARQLGRFVAAVCKATGQSKVHLIGHSMGGLTIRAWIHAEGAERVSSVITLGTPHHGTLIAHGVSSGAVDLQQMRIRNPWLEALNRHEVKPFPVPITSVITPHDNIVFPQDSAVLAYPNANNIFLPGEGHLQMIRSRRILAEIVATLRASES